MKAEEKKRIKILDDGRRVEVDEDGSYFDGIHRVYPNVCTNEERGFRVDERTQYICQSY